MDAREDRAPLAITDAVTGDVVGSIEMRINRLLTGHVGYWVAAEPRGRGVAPDALRALSRWAFEELGVGRVELVTDPENVASQRVAEKAGFQREAVLRSILICRDGSRRDGVMFSLLPGELGYAARSRSRHSGSSSRSRRTRAPSGGCVTNIAASPCSANGFTV
jgi:RimJ/RimL family protein N-acetyltransferase